MYHNTHFFKTQEGMVLVPAICEQPINLLATSIIEIPFSLIANGSQLVEQSPQQKAKETMQTIISKALLFGCVHQNPICADSCSIKNECPLRQTSSDRVIVNGHLIKPESYKINPSYEFGPGDAIMTDNGLTISTSCPLSPAKISCSIVMKVTEPSALDDQLRPEGLIYSPHDGTQSEADNEIKVSLALTNTHYTIKQQPSTCNDCNEFCSFNPKLRKINPVKDF